MHFPTPKSLLLAVTGTALFSEAAPTSQISKVIDMLMDMKTQVDSETAKGEEEAETTENQCIADISHVEGDVKYTSEKAEEAAAAKEEGAAKAATYAAEANSLAPKIADAEGAKDKAKKEQAEAVATFSKEEAELSEAITMLTQAYSVLKRSLSFAQTDKPSFLQKSDDHMFVSQNAKRAVAALSAVVNAAWVSIGDYDKVKSFLLETEATDGLSLKQPQASTSNYDSKSGGILAAIESMQDKASEELTKLREKALKGKHSYELLSQDLTSKIELFSDQMTAAKASSAEAAAASDKAGAELSDASEALDSFKSQLSDTKAACQKAAADWSARKTEALEESSTIQQAVDVLNTKFGSAALIQLGFRTLSKKGANEIEIREQVSSLLRKLSEKYENLGFLQAASSAEADPFTKVRKMINGMIVKLEDEQSAEAAKEGKCKADLSKGKTDVKVKTQQLKNLQARTDKANARLSELQTDIQELSDSVRLLKASQGQWTKDRNASRAENSASLKEAKASIEALNAAIGILSEFYGSSGSALIQTRTGKLSDKGDAIIQILETAQSDFEKIRQTTETSEKDAQAMYEKDMQDSEVSLAKSNAMIEGKTSEVASIKVQLGQLDEDLANAQKGFEAAGKYLAAVQEACANKPMSFEERQSKRKSEIEGLKTALEILSG